VLAQFIKVIVMLYLASTRRFRFAQMKLSSSKHKYVTDDIIGFITIQVM